MQNRKPMVLVFAGPNGSGKSTITEYFEIPGKYTNADDVVLSSGISNEEAAVLVDKSRYDSIKRKEDFTFETVLSSNYKLDLLNEAKAAGYFIKCVFLLTKSPLINVKRYDNTLTPFRVIRKHKEKITLYPNDFWMTSELKDMIGL